MTPVQAAILVLASQGETYTSIANRLKLAPATIDYHARRIQEISQTRTMAMAVAAAMVAGILTNNQWPVEATGQLFFGIGAE